MIDTEAELDLLNELRQLYTKARDAKRRLYPNWQRNYKLLNNVSADISAITPQPRCSEIYPILSSLVAWMMDQNVSFQLFPACDPNSPYFQATADIANDLEVLLNSTHQTNHDDAQIKLVIWDALLYGAGFIKTIWDKSLSNNYGDARLTRVDPYSFYPDPDATSTIDAEYFIEVRKMSMAEVERRYPNSHLIVNTSGEGIDSGPSGGTGGTGASNIGRLPSSGSIGSLGASTANTNYSRSGSAPNTVSPDSVTVFEFWLKENEAIESYSDDTEEDHPDPTSDIKFEEYWRVVVVANNQILLDERADELWSYGSHPYSRYLYDDIGEFYGISLVDHLAHPQLYINRLLTAVQQNVELTGNPIFLEATNSGTDRVTMINRPGQRLRVNPGAAASGNRPDWLRPPEIPGLVMELINFWVSKLESISGLTAITKGATPGQRNAEGVINTIQEAAFVRIRAGLSNLEQTLESAISKKADLIIDNYDEARLVSIIGEEGRRVGKLLKSRHFEVPIEARASDPKIMTAPLKYTITVKAGSDTPTSRQARIAETDKLFAMGAIDDEAVLQVHQFPHYQEVIQRKYQKIKDGTFAPPNKRQASGRSK
jgi:hypothetical protein